jgi:hypothetical protein
VEAALIHVGRRTDLQAHMMKIRRFRDYETKPNTEKIFITEPEGT